MTLRLVHRPTRLTRPIKSDAAETVAAPPTITDGHVSSLPIQSFLPVIGALSSVIMIVVLRNSNPVFLVVGGLLLVVALIGGLAMALSHRGSATRNRRTQREHYLDFLEKLRARMRVKGREVRAAAALLDPEPAALVELVRDPARLWERRRHHSDFCRVRLGVGDRAMFSLAVPEEQNPVQPYDPIMINEVNSVVAHYRVVRGMPVTVNLDRAGQVAIIGDRKSVLCAARSMIVQLAALHAPDDVRIAAAFPREAAADWSGLDLLPHVIDPELYDGPVPARRIAGSAAGLTKVLGQDLADRVQVVASAKRSGFRLPGNESSRLVIFLDDYGRVASTLPVPDAELSLRDLSVTTVHLLSDRLHEPSDVTVRIMIDESEAHITDTRLEEDDHAEAVQRATLDATPATLFEAIARTLTPLRLSVSRQDEVDTARDIGITELLGIPDVTMITPDTMWQPRSPRDFLRVPIGLDDFGAPILLDLKESAQLGMGPHGICIGATGSGKSEMLRTLITALALSHPPEDLSMVLVDYKGGAAFAPFSGLPHVAGIIDNLADDPQLTERARASINGEVVRRQELLRDAGSIPSISHYRELRIQRPELRPLPHLLIVIDEFGELLTAEPDFVDLLITIGRIGRSIGVHLLLSSQRIEAGKLRGLDSYLSYRVGLRTFSESESSVVLDTPDAFHLPAIPGYGYLKVDTSVYRRFRSGYVSGSVAGAVAPVLDADSGRPQPLLLPTFNGLAKPDVADDQEQELTRPEIGRPLVAECVDRLRLASRQVQPVWLPPLPSRLALSRVVSDDEPRVGRCAAGSHGAAGQPSKAAAAALVARLEQGRRPYRGAGCTSVRPQHLLAHHGSVGGTDPYSASAEHVRHGPEWRRAAADRRLSARRRCGDALPSGPSTAAAGGAAWHAGDSGAGVPGARNRLARVPSGRARCRSDSRAGLCRRHLARRRLRSAAYRFRGAGGQPGHVVAARWQLRHPRRFGHDALERAADGPAAADRHPAGTQAERSGRLADWAQVVGHPPGRSARAAAHRGEPVRPGRAASAGRYRGRVDGARRSRPLRRVRPLAGKDLPRRRFGCCRPTSPPRNCPMLWTNPSYCPSGCARTPWSRPSWSWAYATSI